MSLLVVITNIPFAILVLATIVALILFMSTGSESDSKRPVVTSVGSNKRLSTGLYDPRYSDSKGRPLKK